MALTEQQRAELAALDPATIRVKLMHAGPGRGAVVPGFKGGMLVGDVEDYLAERHTKEKKVQNWVAIIGVIGVVATVVGIGVAIWLAK